MTAATRKPNDETTPRWEKIRGGDDHGPETHRFAVPGGWLYMVVPMYRERLMVFVPDPDRVTVIGANGRPMPFDRARE